MTPPPFGPTNAERYASTEAALQQAHDLNRPLAGRLLAIGEVQAAMRALAEGLQGPRGPSCWWIANESH